MGVYHSQFSYIFSQIRYATCPPSIASISHLIVEVEQGQLRGKESIAKYSRKKYCSFLGIPFAKPPLGNLRFMPPEDCDPWETLYDATYERSHCLQYDPLLMLTYGGEDCLHMNIFTPQPPKMIQDLLPVMVFIHGGGFCCGSGSRKLYGADFLINHDVILVAPNYRLNVFGFLNLGIKECPGNVGLKDIILSLQWIKRNIRNFGGDPDNVTLFGESAGATAVRYLQISPLARGLFSKAIIQSSVGNLYYPFDDPIEMAFTLGAKLGYLGNDRLKLVQHLRSLSCSELHRAVPYLIADKVTKIFEFGPTVESIAEGSVMPPNFEELAKHSTPMPTIYGCLPVEGSPFLLARKSMQRRTRDCMKLLTDRFKMNPELHPVMEKEMRKIYFGDKQVDNSTVDLLLNLLTDILLYRAPDEIISLIDTKAPIYLYQFTYLGRLNIASVYARLLYPWLALLNNFKKAQHADELGYLFCVKLAAFYPPLSDSNKKMINLMTTMWTNFAKTGNPSTSEVKWKPTTHDDMCYLDINDESEMKSGTIYAETLVKLHELIDPVLEKFL